MVAPEDLKVNHEAEGNTCDSACDSLPAAKLQEALLGGNEDFSPYDAVDTQHDRDGRSEQNTVDPTLCSGAGWLI